MSKSGKNNEPIWVPVKFVKAGHHLLVHLVNPENLNFNFGFIRDSLNHSLDQPVPEKILPLNTWLEETKDNQSELESIGFIFHVSRCGSTLLSQNLKATGLFFVLGEPSFFTSIYKDNRLFSSELQSVVAQKTLLCWKRWAQYKNKQLLIKLTSNILIKRERISQDFPKSKTFFLFREPKSVIESLVRKPPSYLKEGSWRDERTDLLAKFETQVSPSVLRASKKYLSYFDEIYAAASKGAPCCDYEDIETRFNEIAEYFLLSSIKQKFNWCDTWDSKNGEWKKTTYTPIDQQIVSKFSQINAVVLNTLSKEYLKLSSLIGMNKVNGRL